MNIGAIDDDITVRKFGQRLRDNRLSTAERARNGCSSSLNTTKRTYQTLQKLFGYSRTERERRGSVDQLTEDNSQCVSQPWAALHGQATIASWCVSLFYPQILSPKRHPQFTKSEYNMALSEKGSNSRLLHIFLFQLCG
jgi:hypothetical protein